MKILVILLCAILVGLGTSSCLLGDDETFILPKEYRGFVLVIFNQQNGQKIKYENGRRIYEVPADGILRTQFSPNKDWHRADKYFYIENGKMIEIPAADYKDLNSNLIQACCLSSGRTGRTPDDMSIEFAQFYVGTKADIDAASEKANKIKIPDLIDSKK